MNTNKKTNVELFHGNSISEYFQAYQKALFNSLASVSKNALEEALNLIQQTSKANAHIYAGGNGGSAAICDHLCCDWMKGTAQENHPPIKVHSLNSNHSLSSAISNDLGYEFNLSKQVEWLIQPQDLLILISSSGNSKNIINAADAAKKNGAKIIGLSGFNGGELKNLCDISLHVESNNYGVIEDCHQAIMHTLSQFLVVLRKSNQ